jgi:hypothetical protein
MTSGGPGWLKYPKDLIEKGESYLAKHGYQDHDLQDLIDTAPTDLPDIAFLRHALDDRPRAEIVATAHMVYLAELVLEAHELGDLHMVSELMYLLGHWEALAKLFILDPGHSPEMATNHDGFLHLAVASKAYTKKRVKDHIRTERARGKRPDHKDRNNWLIFEAKKLLGPGLVNGKDPREITSILVNRYSREHPNAGPLSEKQIRRILRAAEVIPPARPRK